VSWVVAIEGHQAFTEFMQFAVDGSRITSREFCKLLYLGQIAAVLPAESKWTPPLVKRNSPMAGRQPPTSKRQITEGLRCKTRPILTVAGGSPRKMVLPGLKLSIPPQGFLEDRLLGFSLEAMLINLVRFARGSFRLYSAFADLFRGHCVHFFRRNGKGVQWSGRRSSSFSPHWFMKIEAPTLKRVGALHYETLRGRPGPRRGAT